MSTGASTASQSEGGRAAAPLRDRIIVAAALALLTALAWTYLVLAPMPMPATSGGLRTAHYAAFTFAMWAVMMVGMMVPSVAPVVLLFNRIQRRSRSAARALPYSASFVTGYLVAWTGFSILATAIQIALIEIRWIDDMGVVTSKGLAAALLVAVAAYQWLPAKAACLDHCRSPAEFLVAQHRRGLGGALRQGLHHGLYCLGCCWALMLLLFVGGVMNLLWVATLAAVVLAEKLLARGAGLKHAIAVAALLAAALIVLSP